MRAGDGISQPYEPQLNWARFSLLPPEAQVPRLHEVLGAVPPAQVADMQVRATGAGAQGYRRAASQAVGAGAITLCTWCPRLAPPPQRALRCAAQHFVWSGIAGGFMGETGQFDAFETLLEILR